MSQKTPYQLLGEQQGIKALADAFYDEMCAHDDTKQLRDMHGDDLTQIKQKLFEYLSGWLGGPPLYQEKYGTVCLTSPHKAYRISKIERNQWLLCWDRALAVVQADNQVKAMLKQPITRMADMLVNHP